MFPVSLALHNDDCESTPSTMKSTDTDDSMNASLITKSGCSTESRRTSFSDFQSWTEVFEHLKREIVRVNFLSSNFFLFGDEVVLYVLFLI